MQQAFENLKAAQHQLEDLDERVRQLTERRDLLEFQRHELTGAAIVDGEEAELRADRERLRHADRIARVCNDGEQALYSANDAMVTRLAKFLTELETLTSLIPDLVPPAELVEQGRLYLEEAALQLRAIGSHAESDPSRLDQIEQRLALLTRLAKSTVPRSPSCRPSSPASKTSWRRWRVMRKAAAAPRKRSRSASPRRRNVQPHSASNARRSPHVSRRRWPRSSPTSVWTAASSRSSRKPRACSRSTSSDRAAPIASSSFSAPTAASRRKRWRASLPEVSCRASCCRSKP